MKRKSDFFNTSLIYFILISLFVLIRIGSALRAFDWLGGAADTILSLIIQVGIMFALPVLLSKTLNKKTYKQTFKDFRFNKVSAKAVLLSIGIGILACIINFAVASFFYFLMTLLGYSKGIGSGSTGTTVYTFWMFLLTLFNSAILPGICEETAHRGMLLYGFRELGVKKVIILSSLLFGLMHLNIEQFFYASVLGAFMGGICVITNSIVPGMIVHFMNNAINTYLDFAAANNLFLGDLPTKISNFMSQNSFIVSMLLVLVVLAVVVFLTAWLVYLLFKETTGKKLKSLAEDLKQIPDAESQTFQIPVEYLGINIHQKRKPAYVEKIFLFSTLIMSISVTISTFIWGVL